MDFSSCVKPKNLARRRALASLHRPSSIALCQRPGGEKPAAAPAARGGGDRPLATDAGAGVLCWSDAVAARAQGPRGRARSGIICRASTSDEKTRRATRGQTRLAGSRAIPSQGKVAPHLRVVRNGGARRARAIARGTSTRGSFFLSVPNLLRYRRTPRPSAPWKARANQIARSSCKGLPSAIAAAPRAKGGGPHAPAFKPQWRLQRLRDNGPNACPIARPRLAVRAIAQICPSWRAPRAGGRPGIARPKPAGHAE